jgi:tetratricopeptide (TPR) repeat protein
MVTALAAAVGASLVAAGLAKGTKLTADEVKHQLRQHRLSPDLADLATEFGTALETAIHEEQARLVDDDNSKALAPVTELDWDEVLEQLADDDAAPDTTTRREREELRVVFEDEEDAIARITTALCDLCDGLGTAVDHTPDLRQTVETAVARAYRTAIAEFKDTLAADDELAALFDAETDLELLTQLDRFQTRLTALDGALDAILSQPARNDGFVRLSPALFGRVDETDEIAWRTTFSLADVHAGAPARRSGHEDDRTASEELFDALVSGQNRLVVGRPGGGKSTLCKQVALDWYHHPETGAVLYREYGRGDGAFESVGSLADTVEAADGHTLVVVEDAPRARANTIAQFVATHTDAPDVTVLLDARASELDGVTEQAHDDSATQRVFEQGLLNIDRYPLPALTVDDVERAIAAFEASTGQSVRRDPAGLHEQVTDETVEGVGTFLLLSFYFPVGEDDAPTGLEGHVRDRYRTLDPADTAYDPGESAPDLSQYDADLVADIGAMVTLLSAAGIGVYPELVASLVVGDARDGWAALDRVNPILDALTGWLVFTPPSTDGAPYVVHQLWATLYLREHARDHADEYDDPDIGNRSEPRVSRCLDALFRLCDTPERRDALLDVMPGASVLEEVAADSESKTAELVESMFEVGARWPVLAPLFGTTNSAQYELPQTLPGGGRQWVMTIRGHVHRGRGAYDRARTEYDRRLQHARDTDDRSGEAKSLTNLGNVAQAVGEYDEAREYYQQSLAIFRDLGNRPDEAASLNNLGVVAREVGEYDDAWEYHQQSLGIDRDLGDRSGKAASLGNLGNVAYEVGEYDEAREYHQQSLALFRDLGDRSGEAASLANLGQVAYEVGEYNDAREYHQQSLAIKRDLGDRAGEATSLDGLGNVARSVGEYDDARERYEAARDLFAELGAIHHEFIVRQNLVRTERAAGAVARARERCEAALARLDEFERELPDRREWFVAVLGELVDATDTGD